MIKDDNEMATDTSRGAVEALIAEAQVIAWNPFPPMSNRDATLTERMQDTLAALLDERDAARDASVWRDTNRASEGASNNIEIQSATHAYLTRMEVDEYLVRINSIIIGNVTANISAIFRDIIKAQNFLEDIGVAGWDYKSLMD